MESFTQKRNKKKHTRGQERIKFKRRIDEPQKTRKLSVMISTVNKQNLKMTNAESRLMLDLTKKQKSNRQQESVNTSQLQF
jgi:hypothetical protein